MITSAYTIREATAADIPDIVDLARALLEESRNLDEDDLDEDHLYAALHELLLVGDGLVALGLDGGKPVGVAAVARATRFWTGDEYATDLGLYVSREQRGTGLAADLVRACEHWCGERGIRELMWGVSTGLPMAERLYERLGYQRSGVALRKFL